MVNKKMDNVPLQIFPKRRNVSDVRVLLMLLIDTEVYILGSIVRNIRFVETDFWMQPSVNILREWLINIYAFTHTLRLSLVEDSRYVPRQYYPTIVSVRWGQHVFV